MHLLNNSLQATSEHEIETFLWFQVSLDQLGGGMLVKTKGLLSEALGKLSYFPFLSLSLAYLNPAKLPKRKLESCTPSSRILYPY